MEDSERRLEEKPESKFELRVSPASAEDLPLLITLLSGERLCVFCNPNDKFFNIKKLIWEHEGLSIDASQYIFRLRNAEAFFWDNDTFADFLTRFLLFREDGFTDSMEVLVIDKKDVGDSEKRKRRLPSSTGLIRAQGYLKKKGSGGTHQWQERYFLLQDNTLFYFGSVDELEKKTPAGDVIPMGSCIVDALTRPGGPAHARMSSLAQGVLPTTTNRTNGRQGSISSPPVALNARVKLSQKPDVKPAGNVKYMFRVAADTVGKREFLLRTRIPEVMRLWVDAIKAVNLARVKFIVSETTREIIERIDREELLQSPKAIESKETEKVMRAYAYGVYPKLADVEDFVLSEAFHSALSSLETPLLGGAFLSHFQNNTEITVQQLKNALQPIPVATRALLEHVIHFCYAITQYSEVNGMKCERVAKLMEASLFGIVSPFEAPIDRVRVLRALIDQRPKLWPLNPIAYALELKPTLVTKVGKVKPGVSQPGVVTPRGPPAKIRRGSRETLNTILLLKQKEQKEPKDLPPLKLADDIKVEPKPTTVVRFPLTFNFPSEAGGNQKGIEVRVIEELVAVEGRPYTPGRFYCFEDLLVPSLGGGQHGTPETLLQSLGALAHNEEWSGKSIAFVPEVVAMVYLIQRQNLAAVSQILNYLVARPPLPRPPITSKLIGTACATEPSFLDRNRRQLLAAATGQPATPKTTETPRKHPPSPLIRSTTPKKAAKTASKRFFHHDDDDDFVDIDTAPPETPRLPAARNPIEERKVDHRSDHSGKFPRRPVPSQKPLTELDELDLANRTRNVQRKAPPRNTATPQSFNFAPPPPKLPGPPSLPPPPPGGPPSSPRFGASSFPSGAVSPPAVGLGTCRSSSDSFTRTLPASPPSRTPSPAPPPPPAELPLRVPSPQETPVRTPSPSLNDTPVKIRPPSRPPSPCPPPPPHEYNSSWDSQADESRGSYTKPEWNGAGVPPCPSAPGPFEEDPPLMAVCYTHGAEAVVWCKECKEVFCPECDDFMHIGPKSLHNRTSLEHVPPLPALLPGTDPALISRPSEPEALVLPPLKDNPKPKKDEEDHGKRDAARKNSADSFIRSPRMEPSRAEPHHRSMTLSSIGGPLKPLTFEGSSETMGAILKPVSFQLDSPFDTVMRYADSRNCFRKFLATEFSDENICFWDEVNKFCEADGIAQYKMARTIFEVYFGPRSAKQVNVRGMYGQLKDALATTDQAEAVAQCTFLFLEAQAAVVQLLRFDSFSRFKASEMWKEFVEQAKQRDLVRMKVMKLKKVHKNVMRVLQFDSNLLCLTFFKQDQDGEFAKTDLVIPAGNLVNVQLSVTNNKKLKITFFRTDQRLLRNQKEWRLIFRTTSERERLTRLITSHLLLKQSSATTRASYQPQPLTLEKKTMEKTKLLPVHEVASELHESWMAAKRSEGWTHGETYSEDEKMDPNLVPWNSLKDKEQEYAVDVAALTIGSIMELGYSITNQTFELDPQVVDLEEDSRLLLLVEFLSENAHDCWAANKLKQGWTFGDVRSDNEKTHPNLIPYFDLHEADQDWNRQAAITVLRALLERGFKIEPEL